MFRHDLRLDPYEPPIIIYVLTIESSNFTYDSDHSLTFKYLAQDKDKITKFYLEPSQTPQQCRAQPPQVI